MSPSLIQAAAPAGMRCPQAQDTRPLAIAYSQQNRLTLLATLQTDYHIGVDEIDLIVLQACPPSALINPQVSIIT